MRYDYFEGNHGDQTVYFLSEEQVQAFWKYKLNTFSKYFSHLSFELKKLTELSDCDCNELMRLCKIPKDKKSQGDYYVIQCTDLETNESFFEEEHTL